MLRGGEKKVFGYAAICVLVATTVGCSSLIVRSNDGTGEQMAKGATRAVLGIGTLGISELSILEAKQRENRESIQRQENSWVANQQAEIARARRLALNAESEAAAQRWLRYHDQLASELNAYYSRKSQELARQQANRQAAAALMLRTIQSNTYQPVSVPQLSNSTTTHCQSYISGNLVTTNCY